MWSLFRSWPRNRLYPASFPEIRRTGSVLPGRTTIDAPQVERAHFLLRQLQLHDFEPYLSGKLAQILFFALLCMAGVFYRRDHQHYSSTFH